MVRYRLEDVTDDMVLGESIFLQSGELLLAAGYHLTERFRIRLSQLGFHSVMINIPGTDEVVPETIISEHVQRELASSMKRTNDDLKKIFTIRQEGSRSIRTMIRKNRGYLAKFLQSSGLINSVEKMIDEILNSQAIVLNMQAMRSASNDLFEHAIRVTVTSMAIARKYHFAYDEMKQLAIGSMNYDLGLITIPPEILNKKEALTEDEQKVFQQHTVHGYLMLKQNPAIAATSAAIAIQHHEHQDGTGYPRQIRGANLTPQKDFSRKGLIHRFSEIVAVADAYDVLITDREGTQPLSNRDALRKLLEHSGNHLNSDIVRTLMDIVPLYPVGARFRVDNAPTPQLVGYYGVVARVDERDMENPEIILYETKNHQKIKPILIIALCFGIISIISFWSDSLKLTFALI